jgi:hypothetical protein
MNLTIETRLVVEPFVLHPVEIFKLINDVDRQAVDMTHRVARPQQRIAVSL